MQSKPVRYQRVPLVLGTCPKFKFYSAFSSDSVGLCLAFGIFEIIARFNGSEIDFAERFLRKIRVKINELEEWVTLDQNTALVYLENIIRILMSFKDPKSTFEYLEFYGITYPEISFDLIAKAIYLILASFGNQNEDFNHRFNFYVSGEVDESVFDHFCKYFKIYIKVYLFEGETKNYTPSKLNDYPVLSLLKYEKSYFLIYTQEMISQESVIDPEDLANKKTILFFIKRKQKCSPSPTLIPRQTESDKTVERTQYENALLKLIAEITKEVGDQFSPFLRNKIKKYAQENESIRSIPELQRFLNTNNSI
jgi:hypothetical protein